MRLGMYAAAVLALAATGCEKQVTMQGKVLETPRCVDYVKKCGGDDDRQCIYGRALEFSVRINEGTDTETHQLVRYARSFPAKKDCSDLPKIHRGDVIQITGHRKSNSLLESRVEKHGLVIMYSNKRE